MASAITDVLLGRYAVEFCERDFRRPNFGNMVNWSLFSSCFVRSNPVVEMTPSTPQTVFRFKPGRVVEIAHDTKGFGYLIANFNRPRYGSFYNLVTKVYETSIADSELNSLVEQPFKTVWLNSYRLLGRDGLAEYRRRKDLASFTPQIPKFWFGPERGPITLQEPDGRISYEVVTVPLEILELEMERRGYTQKVMWLPSSIIKFLFEGHQLRWSAIKEY